LKVRWNGYDTFRKCQITRNQWDPPMDKTNVEVYNMNECRDRYREWCAEIWRVLMTLSSKRVVELSHMCVAYTEVETIFFFLADGANRMLESRVIRATSGWIRCR
jgi:hypothetical protein